MSGFFNFGSDPYPGKALKEGDKGNNVAKIQVWLNFLSKTYLPLFSLKIDGIFGKITKNNVMIFQKMFSLTADGVVGEKTWQQLSCVYNSYLSEKSYPIKPNYLGYGLGIGAVDDFVKILQYMLFTVAGKYPEIKGQGNIKVDGIFGEMTKTAVMKFQKIAHITVDGVAGKITWNALYPIFKDIVCGKGVNCKQAEESLKTKAETAYRSITKTKQKNAFENSKISLPTKYEREIDANLSKYHDTKQKNEYNDFATPATQTSVNVQAFETQSCIVPYPGSALRNGSTGANVVVVQKWLNGIAYSYPAIQVISADGKFGNKTQTQVQTFQTMFGLSIDGVVGQKTWTKLNSVYCNVSAGLIHPITPVYIGYPLSQGATGGYVKTIQYMLNVIEPYFTQIALLSIDGVWGSATTAAVKAYQGIFGLKVDGVVGQITWTSIVNVYTQIMLGNIPSPTNPDQYPGTPIQIGDSGPYVTKIQTWINLISGYYSPITAITVDGKFGSKTQAQVIAIQTMFGLVADGVVGEITWNQFVVVKNALGLQKITPITPKYIGYPVSQGSTGNYIKDIQYMLNTVKKVYPTIPMLTVDGVYGSVTASAIREFQRLSSLTVDGVVGAVTFSTLVAKYTQVIGGSTPVDPDVYPGYPIKIGDSGANVSKIQGWQSAIAPHYTPIVPPSVDGYFGVDTLNATTCFQNMFGLTQNGIVEETTWNGLKYVYNNYTQGNITTITPDYPGTPLKIGCSGNTVKSVQYMYNNIALAYPEIGILKVDGSYGVKTRNTVMMFQGMFGLTVDGVVGIHTWNKTIAIYASVMA